MTDSLLAFFTVIDNQCGVIVKEAPKFDLDLYIQSYRGRTRFDRLLLIGRSSVPLCVDALKAAVAEAKRGRDPQRYREAVECLRIAAPSEPEASFDKAWLENTETANQNETRRLTAELKGYKNNLIKESIRMGNEDLGKHYESIGDLNAAAEAYSKMRPDVSTSKQIIDVGRHLVSVALQRREWGMITSHLSKMPTGANSDEYEHLQPYIKIVTGLSMLGQERFLEAAMSFLAVDVNISSTNYNEVASPSDVAVYGGLLALATMDRAGLQQKVLEAADFRQFLEHAPHIRRAVAQFVNGRYSACISTLEAYRADYLLDIHLQKHIPKVYAQIRSKCIVQYMIPFSCVSLGTLEAAFSNPAQSIEEELFAMIRSGTLQARINAIDKLVTTVATNPRVKLQSTALATAQSYEKQAIDRLRRMSLAAADLELKGQRKTNTSFSGLGGAGDIIYDEATMV
ncbi:26S proteasome subunit RPN7-domain-containing protein [Podospora appendiculata]|uniref:COP9 signalosome complex subunit 1 n=1 Tax=Podospora appendiculata TaxID=314037 RepID=A0AAE0XFP6_9PEZI|nr:26S proteasome subunit RPN7-domain-containing protein [Podospora appendiculata]